MLTPVLEMLAQRWGAQTGYWDVDGNWHHADREALVQVLVELGAPVGEVDTPEEAVQFHDRELLAQAIEPMIVVPDGATLGLLIRQPEPLGGDSQVSLEVTAEDGTVHRAHLDLAAVAPHDGGTLPGGRYTIRWIDTGIVLPVGYHTLRMELGGGEHRALVLAPPARLPAPPSNPGWGLFAPVYAFQPTGRPGAEHLGVGHLGQLEELGQRAWGLGARVVSTLPLLAAYLDEPFEPSPYSPVSRRWWSELPLDPSQLPGLAESPTASSLIGSSRFSEAAQALARAPLVDYHPAATLMRELLEALSADLAASRGPTAEAWARFSHTQPELDTYARFRAAVEQYGPDGVPPPGQPFPRLEPAAVDRHRYIQFAAETQLAQLAGSFRSREQLLALDLPLGTNPAGYDVWADPGNFAAMATGAPPDDLFRGGQNWGFPPPHPIRARARGHRDLILSVRHHLRHSGLLRVDHLMSLERLWWIPDGFAATQGIYVRYPTDELMAVLAIEATRAGAVVVGENLGTVSDEINETMNRWGMLGMYELQFEGGHARDHGHLRPPAPLTVAGLNTHDMPTFAGWWQGHDLAIGDELGLTPEGGSGPAREQRVADRAALVAALAAHLGRPVPDEPGPALEAALDWLGETEAAVVLASLEDLWLESEPQNVPGTHRERPNWRRRFARTLAQAFGDPHLLESLGTLDRARRRSPGREPH